jgi:predicted DNA binding CopG/RHH family protein
MDEKELAAQLQDSKDDSDEWGGATPNPEPAPKRRLAAMVSVRLSPEELEAVQARAAERGETVSGYLRGVALRDVTAVMTVFRLPVFVSPGEPYISEILSSPIVIDGGRLLTRAS